MFFYNNKRTKTLKQPVSFVKEIDQAGLTWIDIIRPTNADMEMLRQKFNFHELLLEDCMTEHQRSKVDDYGDYSFIVLHLPRYKKELVSLESAEVDVFIGRDYLVTIHEGELKPLLSLSELCETSAEARSEFMNEGPVILLYEILKRLFDYCLPMLDKMGAILNEINHSVSGDTSKSMLEKISRMKLQIINYRKIIKPLRLVIRLMEKAIKRILVKEMEIYFDDIIDKVENIWDLLENYKEIIEAIDSTYSALTNQKNNSLMRTFTILQVIILPMVLVGGLFSMNVQGIPMSGFSNAFWIVFGMILIPTGIISTMMLINRKKWF